MFGKVIPDGPNIIVEIRLALSKGWPVTAWRGSGKTPEADVLEEITRSSNVMQYINKAAERGRLKVDELGTCLISAKLLVYNDKEFLFDDTIEFVLSLVSPREDLTNQTVVLEKLFAMYTASLKDITVAATASLSVASAALKDVASAATTAVQQMAESHSKTTQKGHEQLGLIANSADRLSGLAQEIFKDSGERAAALIQEVRNQAQPKKTQDPMADFKGFLDLFGSLKALIPDGDEQDGGKQIP